MIDVDIMQRIKVGGIFLLQIYKVATGTLLSLFVPQSCGEQICSLTENYENSDEYHQLVLYWNMFSMFTFFSYYMVELVREEWAIKNLDIDNDKSDNSLKEIIILEPILDRRMDKLNKYYYNLLLVNCSVYFVNILLTIKLLKDGYHSMSTVSCFASFTLLVLMKLYNSFVVAHASIKSDKMMSAYMCEFVSYNVLDADYVKAKNDKNLVMDDIKFESDPKKTIESDPKKTIELDPKKTIELDPKKTIELDTEKGKIEIDGSINVDENINTLEEIIPIVTTTG